MKNGVMVTWVMAALLSCTGVAWGAGINRVGGVGPRDIAMGGAGTAVADDTAIFYRNPSLLATTDNFVQIGTDYIQAHFKYRDPLGQNHDSDTGKYFVPFAGVNYRPTQKLAVGLGVTEPDIFGSDFKQNLGFFSKIYLTEISPTVAYRVIDNLSIGAALKIGYGNIKLSQPILISGVRLGQLDTKADGWGYGWQAGVSWKPTSWLSIGASYQSKIKVSLSGKTDASTPLGSSSNDFDADFFFPARYGMGIGLEFGDLLIAAEGIRFDYSSTDKVDLRYKQGPHQTLVLDWNDNWYAGLGLEYKLFKYWRLRAGIAYQDAVVPDKTISPATPDMNGWSLSGGVGYRGKHWGADLSYLHAWGLERTVNLPNPGAGKYEADVDIISIAASYRFF